MVDRLISPWKAPMPFARALQYTLAFLLCSSALAQSPATAPLPAETFFQPNITDSVEISPSGRWMAIQGRAPGNELP